VYCTHLHHTQESPDMRRAQIEDVIHFIEETEGPGPVILAGDLNARVDAPELEALQERFIDAYGAVHENVDTVTTLNPAKGHAPRRIDHVFVAGGDGVTLVPDTAHRVLDRPVDGVWASDHFGVLVRFRPNPE
ncbi:MAG: endonuclease/exonuclease/phosphatase family protein, partial [Gemmatimonadota bacterium]